MDLAGYLNYVDTVLRDELRRVQECMDISTKRMVLEILQKELILAHKSEILTNKDFSRFILEGKVYELQMMHAQLKRVNASLELRKTWASYLKLRGEELIKEEIVAKKSFRVLEDILDFKKRQEDLLTKVFIDKEDHDQFKLVIKESFEHFLNLNSNVMAEFLAKFLDMHLKKTSTLGSDEALEDLTNQVIQVFRYVKSKDVFEEFYARSLCRRLLLKKSASQDSERSMITKLKTECGDQFTAKVDGMLKDLSLSNQVMQEYRVVRGQGQDSELELHFNVLSQSSWPISAQEQKEVKIPTQLATLQ